MDGWGGLDAASCPSALRFREMICAGVYAAASWNWVLESWYARLVGESSLAGGDETICEDVSKVGCGGVGKVIACSPADT